MATCQSSQIVFLRSVQGRGLAYISKQGVGVKKILATVETMFSLLILTQRCLFRKKETRNC
jgi:hypothetical protein